MNWIHSLNVISVQWAEVMGRAVWQGTLLIVIAWMLSRLATRVLPAAAHSWLWRIVFLKLAVVLVWVTPIRVPVLRAAFPDQTMQVRNLGLRISSAGPDRDQSLETIRLRAIHAIPSQPERLESQSWLFLMWSFGVLACSLGIVRHGRKASQLRRRALLLQSGPLKSLCEDLANELRCKRVPALMSSLDVDSPVVMGVWKPVILIPAILQVSGSSRQSRMMLAHEMAHVHRRDLLWLWLSTLTQPLFFFHPLVWLASRESRLAQEIACDELAVSCLQARPAEYARMLVNVASGTQLPCTTPLAVGVVESYRTMKRRLNAMKHIHSQSKRHLALAAVLTAVLGIGTIIPWQLVAQNPPPAAPTAPPVLSDIPAGKQGTTPALTLPEDEEAPVVVSKPAPSKRKRSSAIAVPAAPGVAGPVIGRNEDVSDDEGDLVIRGHALTVNNPLPKKVPYIAELRSKVGPIQEESSEARDQMLRYRLIFKSGLARLRHLLNQQAPDEADVETALNLVGKLERQLVELTEQTDNRDLKSTGNVIREQLTELNAAVGAATSEKTSQLRAKRLTRAKAIVEGLNELVPDIDSLSAKPNANPTIHARMAPSTGAISGGGGGYGGGGYGYSGGSLPAPTK